MNIDKLPVGKNVPEDVNVIIEISEGGSVKYEIDKETGLIVVDRVLNAFMHYPLDYGFIPNTLSEDGDPLDAMIFTDAKIMPGSVMNCKPVGVFYMEDQAGIDEKIICVPVAKVDPTQEHVKDLPDLSSFLLKKIEHFFKHYKDLEEGKWVKVKGFGNKEEAHKVIIESVERYKNTKK